MHFCVAVGLRKQKKELMVITCDFIELSIPFSRRKNRFQKFCISDVWHEKRSHLTNETLLNAADKLLFIR